MPALRPFHALALLATAALPLLSGCDMLGIEPASAVSARREADGRAVGAACRHSGRGLEDCYSLNRKADKAAVFAGWKEMSDYMRDNKVPEAPPGTAPAAPAPAPAPAAEAKAPVTAKAPAEARAPAAASAPAAKR